MLEHICNIRTIKYIVWLTITLVCFNAEAAATSQSATVDLGSSGIKAMLTETPIKDGDVAMHRAITFWAETSKLRTLKLQDDRDGNGSTNLYYATDGDYVFVSKKDCVIFDPTAFHAHLCEQRDLTKKNLRYLGRFDWMNKVDNGKFELRFRYADADQAKEDPSVWKSK
jgi:hypothetical protein